MNNSSCVTSENRLFSGSSTLSEKNSEADTGAKLSAMDNEPFLQDWEGKTPVSDTCADTLATVSKYFQLPEHHQFVGKEKEYAYFQDTLP